MSKRSPTDAEIIEAVGFGGYTQTFHIAGRLNRNPDYRWIDTPWVYRRLRRLEKHGKVKRDYGILWGNTVFWKVVEDETE